MTATAKPKPKAGDGDYVVKDISLAASLAGWKFLFVVRLS